MILGTLERSSVNDVAGLSNVGRKNVILNAAGWNLDESELIDAIAEEIVAQHARTLGKLGIRLTAEIARPYAERAALNGFNLQALTLSLAEADLGARAAIESVIPVSEADPVKYAAQIVAEVRAARKARGMSEPEEGPEFIFAVSNPESVERIQRLGKNINVLRPESGEENGDADRASLVALASWIKDRHSRFTSHTLLLPQTLMGHLPVLRSKLGESLFRKVFVLYMDRLLKATPLLRAGDLLRMERQAAEIAARSA